MTQTRKEALAELLENVEAGKDDPGPRYGWWEGVISPLEWLTISEIMDSGSLAAAQGLHEAMLPRHYAQVHMWPVPEMCRVDIGGGHTGRDDIPARAWLIAILKALIAQEPDQ